MLLVLKFGGTSVGSAQRIKELVKLTVDETPKIVVLSAMSGTTNCLVEICNSLYIKNVDQAADQINKLKQTYLAVINELFAKETTLMKAKNLIDNHFAYITAFTLDMFTANEEKAILAQGELLSTALFHYYLEEIKVDSVLLPALNFMRIDEDDEPNLTYIEKYIFEELKKHTKSKLF
ncbi:MAG: aspartate kinase, partial [Bacteroidota bacterium]